MHEQQYYHRRLPSVVAPQVPSNKCVPTCPPRSLLPPHCYSLKMFPSSCNRFLPLLSRLIALDACSLGPPCAAAACRCPYICLLHHHSFVILCRQDVGNHCYCRRRRVAVASIASIVIASSIALAPAVAVHLQLLSVSLPSPPPPAPQLLPLPG